MVPAETPSGASTGLATGADEARHPRITSAAWEQDDDEDTLYGAYLDGHVAARRGDRVLKRDNPFKPDGPERYLFHRWVEGFRNGKTY